ncbi:hypothetical protein CB1_001683054 [Camelus ferus]|nr:hypothetical protein CB1_001683054 [Camelus ferus]
MQILSNYAFETAGKTAVCCHLQIVGLEVSSFIAASDRSFSGAVARGWSLYLALQEMLWGRSNVSVILSDDCQSCAAGTPFSSSLLYEFALGEGTVCTWDLKEDELPSPSPESVPRMPSSSLLTLQAHRCELLSSFSALRARPRPQPPGTTEDQTVATQVPSGWATSFCLIQLHYGDKLLGKQGNPGVGALAFEPRVKPLERGSRGGGGKRGPIVVMAHEMIGTQIVTERLVALLESGTEKVLLIDSRPFVEYNTSHILEAININCSKLMKRRLQQDKVLITELIQHSAKHKVDIDCSQKVVVYDQSSQDVASLASDCFLTVLLGKLEKSFSSVHLLAEGCLLIDSLTRLSSDHRCGRFVLGGGLTVVGPVCFLRDVPLVP